MYFPQISVLTNILSETLRKPQRQGFPLEFFSSKKILLGAVTLRFKKLITINLN